MSFLDFGRHSEDYAAWRPGFPASFYQRLAQHSPLDSCIALDLATGPGTIALELAARGARVYGVDIAVGQLETALRLAVERQVDGQTSFWAALAEQTCLPANFVDLVTAGQCWHWFHSPVALAESRRVLRPGGVLVIAAYSYLAAHSELVRVTEALVREFNPAWTMAGSSGMFPEQIDDVIIGGFSLVEAFCYDHDEVFSHSGWRGRMRTCNGVGSGGMSGEDVRRFDTALGKILAEKFPEPITVPHRVWCVVARKPA